MAPLSPNCAITVADLPGHRVGQLPGRAALAARLVEEEMLKGGGPLGARGELLDAPELREGGQDGGVCILAAKVAACVLDLTLGNPRADEEGWDTGAETGEIKADVATVLGLLGVGEVVTGRDADWCGFLISRHAPTSQLCGG